MSSSILGRSRVLVFPRTFSGSSRQSRLGRCLSTRVRDVLGRLSIEPLSEIKGVYEGRWGGSGQVVEAREAATGGTLASVRTVSGVCKLGSLKVGLTDT
jgi:hypothetical protein